MELPTDHPRASAATRAPHQLELAISSDTRAALARCHSAAPGELEALLAASVGAVLSRYVSGGELALALLGACLLYTSPSPRDRTRSRMPSSA